MATDFDAMAEKAGNLKFLSEHGSRGDFEEAAIRHLRWARAARIDYGTHVGPDPFDIACAEAECRRLGVDPDSVK